MKNPSQKRLKEHYQALRQLSPDALWNQEVPSFNAAQGRDRLERVSLIRAVGVVFSESGTPAQKAEALLWLTKLLSDPEEKIRRYAMAALPKLGPGESEEQHLLQRLGAPVGEREGRFLAKTLQRVGGTETLKVGAEKGAASIPLDLQRLQANAARRQGAGSISMETSLPLFRGLRLVLECRAGLESTLLGELQQTPAINASLKVEHSGRGALLLRMEAPFSLQALFQLRTFSSVHFPLGELTALPSAGAPLDPNALAAILCSEHAHHLLSHLTEGPVRYRLEFASRKADAALVEAVTEKVFARRPNLLNDPRQALWEIRIQESPRGVSAVLLPRLRPDPRFAYRQGDVPAASHPPLAAAMARLAELGRFPSERIWDPFCGSGLELAECLLRGRVSHVFGTDVDPDAVATASRNLDAAGRLSGHTPAVALESCDFRNAHRNPSLRDLTLVLTNPPLGKRVPVADLRSMIAEVFRLSERLLRPGGRLLLVNPLADAERVHGLTLSQRLKVDLGFGHFPLERWEKTAVR